jgi:hypothetical protein
VRPVLEVRRATLSVEAIATALQLTPGETRELFHDGRLVGWLAELWSARLYGYRRRVNRNDAVHGSPEHPVSVRTLNSHIRFQPSGNQGKGRVCSQDDVIAALERVERFVVVDVRCFPAINFLPLESRRLLKAALELELTPTGWAARRFDDWLSRTYTTQIVPVAGV